MQERTTCCLKRKHSGKASGEDSEITVGELKSYAERAVPRLTEKHTGRPQFFPTGFTSGQDFPVGNHSVCNVIVAFRNGE